MKIASVTIMAVLLLLLVIALTGAMFGLFPEAAADLTDAERGQTVATSGTSTMYIGYVGERAFVSTFLQEGGTRFTVDWSSVRPFTGGVTTAESQPAWTNPNPGPCAADNGICGRLALAYPTAGAPGRPDTWAMGESAEADIPNGWYRQHGHLDLRGTEYSIILTDVDYVPSGIDLTFGWLPWDGTGAPALPTQ